MRLRKSTVSNSTSLVVPSEICFSIDPLQIWISQLADDAIAFAKSFADNIGEAFVKLEEQPPTARIVIRETRLTLDFAGFRAETLEADLCLRDLTINAMAPGSLITLDETGGDFD